MKSAGDPLSSNPAEPLFRIATGFIASAALYVAAHLRVADHLTGGSKSIEELAAGTGANADALYRVLRLLVSLGVFEQVGPRRFALNPSADLLRGDVHGSIHAIAHFLPDPLHFRVYANLLESVKTGLPAVDATLGKPLFEFLAQDPAYSAIFNDAMTALSIPAAAAAIAAYDFSQFSVIVDVAGGHGEVLTAILKACPNSRGVLAETGHVADGARTRIATMGLAHRCEAVTCDFFREVPAGGDAYVMKHIIHDWDDARALQILRNIAQAMGGKVGTVVLLESVIPDGDEPDLGKFIDIEMLALPGGKERTAHEFRVLFDAAGFDLTQIVATKSPLSVIEARRRQPVNA
jgi:hypothetical protein